MRNSRVAGSLATPQFAAKQWYCFCTPLFSCNREHKACSIGTGRCQRLSRSVCMTMTMTPPRAARIRSLQAAPSDDGHAPEKGLAGALGWFGIGLGLAEMIAPRSFARFLGANGDNPLLVRLCGLREIA